ncbi:S1 family peptidase [Timonella sp. A28]|uniref:S1 family peptidase n=1 Tax=Timonella sp. A28 TaxID=3442640 RepID=UPI003EBE6838
MRTPLRSAIALTCAVGLACGLAACGAVPAMPPSARTDYIPADAEPATIEEAQGNLTKYGFSEAQRMAVRVRNVGCSSVTRGTGFAIDSRTLITNKHVVAGTEQLQLNSFDGRDIAVTNSSVAAIADLALVRTEEDLDAFPVVAEKDPKIGDSLTIVGYPNGGALTVTSGVALEYTEDPLNENLGEVLLSDAPVEFGSSGSAVLDDEGRLVGVVYAKNSQNHSYIIPLSTLEDILTQDKGFQPQKAATCDNR